MRVGETAKGVIDPPTADIGVNLWSDGLVELFAELAPARPRPTVDLVVSGPRQIFDVETLFGADHHQVLSYFLERVKISGIDERVGRCESPVVFLAVNDGYGTR